MTNVSRETSEMLEWFQSELLRWNAKINLIASGEVGNVSERHLQDSIQVSELVESPTSWLDLGSGGGFPGIVIAIMHRQTLIQTTLVDSDKRKCSFLRTINRELKLNIAVSSVRIEDLPSQNASTISARALAPLERLLSYSVPHLADDGVMIFPKGLQWRSEVETALATWDFDLQTEPSRTQEGATILMIRHARRR